MRALALTVLLLGGCRAHNDVRLVFEVNAAGFIRGFACRRTVDAESPIISEAVDPATGTLRMGLVIDFLAIERGTPACGIVDILEHCSEQSCEPVPAVRRCLDIVATSETLDPLDLQAQVGEQLREQGPIVEDAPDGKVVVRAVAMRGSCAESGIADGSVGPIDVSRVVGCAHSCAENLDTVEGELELDLQDPSIDCAGTVFLCAQLDEI